MDGKQVDVVIEKSWPFKSWAGEDYNFAWYESWKLERELIVRYFAEVGDKLFNVNCTGKKAYAKVYTAEEYAAKQKAPSKRKPGSLNPVTERLRSGK